MSAAEVYAELRRTGRYVLPADQAGIISTLRRLAKADGLEVSQYRDRYRNRGYASMNQMRNRPYRLNLTNAARTEIVTPDGGQS